ncbi:collagen-like protein [Enterococcus termitis]
MTDIVELKVMVLLFTLKHMSVQLKGSRQSKEKKETRVQHTARTYRSTRTSGRKRGNRSNLPQGPAGTNATTTAVATQTVNGLMSALDKKKLDTLPTITFSKVGSV